MLHLPHPSGRPSLRQYTGQRTLLALGLVAASVLAAAASIYLPRWSICLSLKSLPLVLFGLLFGPAAGALNGALSDLLRGVCGPFTLQAAAIGFIGGLGRTIMGLETKTIGAIAAAVAASFTALYSLIYPSEIPLLLAYALGLLLM